MLLAFDGGGTKTDAVAHLPSGEVLATVRGPRCLPQVDGVPHAVEVLDRLVTRLRALVADASPVEHAGVYLTGMDLPEEEADFEAVLVTRPWAARHVLANDTFALLRTGTREPRALAVVCGTGLNCVGVHEDGRTARFPALGRLSGDWGGGLDLALDAVWHAARAHDGRGPATRLSLDVPRALGRADIRAVSVDLYRGRMAEPELAVVPPLVFAAARAGDAVALGLVQRQADEVVAMATAAARRLDLDGPVPVVLGGSVLAARHALLLDPVEAGLRAAGLEPRLVVPADPPVVGAALLGLAAHLGGPVPADVEARLRTALGSAPTTRTLAVAEEA